MEPRRDDGDDARFRPRVTPMCSLPQWSPVVTTGTTVERLAAVAANGLAAMEPRRDDGDDVPFAEPCIFILTLAAMEPRRDDGDDDLVLGVRHVIDRAAMEPRRDDGDDRAGRCSARCR